MSAADEIRDLLFAECWRLDRATPGTKHVCTNAIIELDPSGTRAEVRSYFLAQQQFDDFPLQPVAAGRYHYTVELHEGAWRFVHREVLVDFTGDTSRYGGSGVDA